MLLLEGVRIPTNSTAESKFFSCSWMLYMKRTFLENIVFHQAVQLLTPDLPLGPVQLLSVPRGIEAAQPLGYSPLAGSRHGSSEKEESSSETYVWSSRSLIYWSKKWYKKTNNVVEKETYITEVRCSKAEKHRHATAVSALRVKSSWDKKRRFWNEPCTPSNLCHA